MDEKADADEGEGEEECAGEELFETHGPGSLVELRAIIAGVRASPQGPAVAGIIRGMSKNLQAVMAEYGF
jgi:hypothetical protein